MNREIAAIDERVANPKEKKKKRTGREKSVAGELFRLRININLQYQDELSLDVCVRHKNRER